MISTMNYYTETKIPFGILLPHIPINNGTVELEYHTSYEMSVGVNTYMYYSLSFDVVRVIAVNVYKPRMDLVQVSQETLINLIKLQLLGVPYEHLENFIGEQS